MTQLYLSRLQLNPYSRQVRRETADPYNLHRTLMKAFNRSREKAGVLHRLDIDPYMGSPSLLVQSQEAPNWCALANGDYLLPPDPFSGQDNPAVKRLTPALHTGQILQFRLRANPTIKKVRRDETGERRHSNRVPLLREDKQLEWLQKRAAASGFQLLQAIPSQAEKQTSRKNGRLLTLYSVEFNGRLQITDTTAFTTALRQGIGPAKAFGCGLLSLAPA